MEVDVIKLIGLDRMILEKGAATGTSVTCQLDGHKFLVQGIKKNTSALDLALEVVLQTINKIWVQKFQAPGEVCGLRYLCETKRKAAGEFV